VLACGGDTKNRKFVQAHADVTGCRVVLPGEPEAVLLGAATLGAVASGDFPSLLAAMSVLNRAGQVIEPTLSTREMHNKKYAAFLKMHSHFMELRDIMG
jgi:ribulose kinase